MKQLQDTPPSETQHNALSDQPAKCLCDHTQALEIILRTGGRIHRQHLFGGSKWRIAEKSTFAGPAGVHLSGEQLCQVIEEPVSPLTRRETAPWTQEYTLGNTSEEQERLDAQRVLYGDTTAMTFVPGSRVCELGCGPGINLWIAQQVGATGDYVGVDFDREQLDKAGIIARAQGLNHAVLSATGLTIRSCNTKPSMWCSSASCSCTFARPSRSSRKLSACSKAAARLSSLSQRTQPSTLRPVRSTSSPRGEPRRSTGRSIATQSSWIATVFADTCAAHSSSAAQSHRMWWRQTAPIRSDYGHCSATGSQ